ncbi:ribosomal biogenesis protein LAS1L-like [Physella acuta]|uniref:ribosomal biogenesis protein LAS1L-like n=1 Tax=Physella acuta TaxID=109671 RepID=UPI0027DB3122|nr:ribosomal biogenesis protein LAS1L-like [Physella acuta]
MAAPLMSLLSPGTIKHVVPWKNRNEFLNVYSDLYSDDVNLQENAINRIAVWKSRAGSKLSVAIESSAMLLQSCMEHEKTLKEGKLREKESQLRSIYSLALIRFVNHVTEKGQTKATAQPIHLIARDFGIPEWIVRLRHEATHASLPCLDALATGARWALGYLKDQFWAQQVPDADSEECDKDVVARSPRFADIRRAFYDFQKGRYQEISSEDKDKESGDHTEVLKVLHKYLIKNRLRFIKCLLEDGILISTEEQLVALGISSSALLNKSPPTVPVEMVNFWRPLLKKLDNAGALPFMLQMAMFSVTSGEGLRNYQLVAWIAFILSQCEGSKIRRKKSKSRKHDSLFKSPVAMPTKTLLTACLQNINGFTAHLLKYLADKESLGAASYSKLLKLLDIQTKSNLDVSSSEDSDTVYTIEDLKQAKQKHVSQLTSSTVHSIQTSMEESGIPWKICTDLVDWSNVPLGVIPTHSLNNEEDDDEEADLNTDDKTDGYSKEASSEELSDSDDAGVGRKRISKEDVNDSNSTPKRTKFIVEDDGLL